MKRSHNFSFLTFVVCFLLLKSQVLFAQSKKNRKVQEVNFSEMNIKGTIRNPDGAYLVQRKGLKFLPLYNLQKDMDQKIRETDLLLR
jgi:hypothetical protein